MLKGLFKQWRSARNAAASPPTLAAAVELLKQGRLKEAENDLRLACAAHPDDAECWHLYGHVLSLAHKYDEAVRALVHAVRLAPVNADAAFNLASALRYSGQYERALESFGAVTRLRPDWALGWLGTADLYAALDAVDQAEDCYRRALAVDPGLPEVHFNFGNLLLRCGLAEEAIGCYREALRIEPAFPTAYSNLLCALNYAGNFSAEDVRDAHFEFDRRFGRGCARPAAARSARSDRPLRVGYVSPDFRVHAVSALCEPALKHHRRDRFVVHCYSDTDKPDARTERLRSYAARWRDTSKLDDDALDAAIREDAIDILVDLAGHTENNRLLVFARKPAPLQVTWIGYPNTTGLSAMDYRITDAIADPPGQTEHLHSERLLRLPHIYLPFETPDEPIDVSPLPAVSNGFVTFGSFNTLMKVSARSIDLWARVLRDTPASRLIIATVPHGRPRAHLGNAFRQRGIDPGRVEFRGRMPQADFLELHRHVDIALDTYPYNGTTTTAHTLWMGVPVISLAGSTHIARVGASMLTNAGVPELLAFSEDDYVKRATELAHDLATLAALRSSLRSRMVAAPNMDGALFTRELEEAYESIWEEYCRTLH